MTEEKKKGKQKKKQLYTHTTKKEEFPLKNLEDVVSLQHNGIPGNPNSPLYPAIPEDAIQRANQFGIILMKMYVDSAAHSEDVEYLSQQAEKYLQYCQEYNQRVTNQGFYYAMGWYPRKIQSIAAGYCGEGMREFLNTIKGYCSMLREQYMANSDLPVPVGIFWQKNYDGFRDNDAYAPITINVGERKTLAELAREVIEFDECEVEE